MYKILIIAAHPDDDILGCGGFIAKYGAYKDIKVVYLTDGATCRYSLTDASSRQALIDIGSRASAAKSALSLLGVTNIVFCEYLCGRLDSIGILDLNKVIESEIKAFNPDTILTHYEYDNNNDHRIVYRSVSMATRPGGLCYVPNLLSFEVQSSTEWNFSNPFQPNYFESLELGFVEKKWQALSCYESEIRQYPHPRSQEGNEVLAKYRGMQAGVRYAEAYKIIRNIAL